MTEKSHDELLNEKIGEWFRDYKDGDGSTYVLAEDAADIISELVTQLDKERQINDSALQTNKATGLKLKETIEDIKNLGIYHDMSHSPFCDEGHWNQEFEEIMEKYITTKEPS